MARQRRRLTACSEFRDLRRVRAGCSISSKLRQATPEAPSVGPIDPPLTLPGPPEYFNEAGQESNADSLTRSSTFVTGGAASTLSGVDVTLNTAPATTIVAETDPGSVFPSAAMALTVTPGTPLQVNGTLSSVEGGNIVFIAGDPVEDWFVIAPPAGLEITKVRLVPAAGDDADLYLASWDATGGFVHVPAASLNLGAGVAEEVSGWFDSTNFGTGSADNKVYIGVSTFTGSPGGAYTLTITASIGDSDAVVLDTVTGGLINANSGTFTVTGRGFKNVGGSPAVTVADPNLTIGTVTYVSATQLDVAFTKGGGFAPGNTSVQVVNQAGSGGYGGRIITIPTTPVAMSAFSVE